MDFALSPEIEDYRRRVRAFVEEHIIPVEADPAAYDAHENIREDRLASLRQKARAQGLWALQMLMREPEKVRPRITEEMARARMAPIMTPIFVQGRNSDELRKALIGGNDGLPVADQKSLD